MIEGAVPGAAWGFGGEGGVIGTLSWTAAWEEGGGGVRVEWGVEDVSQSAMSVYGGLRRIGGCVEEVVGLMYISDCNCDAVTGCVRCIRSLHIACRKTW